MDGATVTKKSLSKTEMAGFHTRVLEIAAGKFERENNSPQIVMLTPEMAVQMLEHNTLNRPLSDHHVQRIARQIALDKWRFNGDTIKIADTGDVLDGQHRLWAVIESKKTVETIIVRGIAREAFATIDTLRKPRSGSDTLALSGATRYRNVTASALSWLIRWQRNILEDYRAPQNKIENSDIEEAFAAHPGIGRAVERAMALRRLANSGIMGFLYYVLTNRDPVLAIRMMNTLENPANVSINDPFFRLRAYFTADHHKSKDPLETIALAIKAANAASKGRKLEVLAWRRQGKTPEAFPTLDTATGSST